MRRVTAFWVTSLILIIGSGLMPAATRATDLEAKMEADRDVVTINDLLVIVLTILNNSPLGGGPYDSPNTRITFEISDELEVTAMDGPCEKVSDQKVICEVGTVKANEEASVTITTTAVKEGTATATLDVEGAEFDPDETNNTLTRQVVVQGEVPPEEEPGAPVLEVEISYDAPRYVVGDVIIATNTVSNVGTESAVNVVARFTAPTYAKLSVDTPYERTLQGQAIRAIPSGCTVSAKNLYPYIKDIAMAAVIECHLGTMPPASKVTFNVVIQALGIGGPENELLARADNHGEVLDRKHAEVGELKIDAQAANLVLPSGGNKSSSAELDVFIDSVRVFDDLPSGQATSLSAMALGSASPFVHVTTGSPTDAEEPLVTFHLSFFNEDSSDVVFPEHLSFVLAGTSDAPHFLVDSSAVKGLDPLQIAVRFVHAAPDEPPVTLLTLDESHDHDPTETLAENLTFGSFASAMLNPGDYNVQVVADLAETSEVFRLQLGDRGGENILVAVTSGPDGSFRMAAFDTSGAGVDASLATDAESGSSIPLRFALLPNYPNPFNPSTRLSFDLPEAAEVYLAVYDLTGREVARLIDTRLPAGRHSIIWQAADMASGAYLYRLTAGSFKSMRPMVLLR